jgi:hypothetical protein
LRKFIPEGFGQRIRNSWFTKAHFSVASAFNSGGHPEYPVLLAMIIIIAQFITDHGKDEETGSYADGQTKDIQEGE